MKEKFEMWEEIQKAALDDILIYRFLSWQRAEGLDRETVLMGMVLAYTAAVADLQKRLLEMYVLYGDPCVPKPEGFIPFRGKPAV